ncbi:hypothetical protein [Flavobacterium sp.]|uniref:hypothetical protein n=1 Tax=Flavobacterium sp. TaxID=239 RepID=UPI002B4B48F3|nr:hypothetical protein [Flavobacterium sp.]HLF52323.1 hypothetical protein [Flavobacterium sp.]
MSRKITVRLADSPDYGSALNKFVDVASGKDKFNVPAIKIKTPQLKLPTVKIELQPETAKLIDTGIKILSGAIVIHAIAMTIKCK